MKAKKSSVKSPPEKYVCRYFDSEWNEAVHLTTTGSICDALLNVSMWAKSRQFDSTDDSLIVFSVYYNYPYISVEEINEQKT
jgi:hypothetical protein